VWPGISIGMVSPTLQISHASLRSLDADTIVIGVVPGPDGPRPAAGAEEIDEAFGGAQSGVQSGANPGPDRGALSGGSGRLPGGLSGTLAALGATGKAEEITKIPALGGLTAPLIVGVGLGEQRPPAGEALRRAAGAAVRAATGDARDAVAQQKTRRIVLAMPAADAAEAADVALGALLGGYAFTRYRTGGRPPEAELTLVAAPSAGDGARAGADRARLLADAVMLVRDLVNVPPSDLAPADLAAEAEQVAGRLGLAAEVLGEKELSAQGYGGILGVGQGSVRPPRLVRLEYRHPEATRTLVLAGKGITFDSGGLSLKPAGSMPAMKSDMGGAAAVLGALQAIASLRPAVNVVGYLPLAENMPSGTAQRPSDVIEIYGGKTVEVLNTDAEGRLVLADALSRGAEDDPALIVDVATLTGSQLVALGSRISGVMASDDAVRDAVVDAAGRAGEAMWPMPLPDELRKGLDSTIADIANIAPDRNAGMLVAGTFLREFIPNGTRWAHLDIAGPAFNEGEPFGYTPKGATGAATRTLVQIAEDVADGRL
jgi:leucyl aminopeptidase